MTGVARLSTRSSGSTRCHGRVPRRCSRCSSGPTPAWTPLKRLLIERTEGNPLFVEESVRALVETGALTGARGAYRLARDLPAIHVPGTVQAILSARIDRLPPEEKRLLEIAAVIGKDFPLALLQAVADQTEEALRRALGHLQTAEFVYETRLSPDLEYTFKHALTHEVAYGSLLHDRRRDLHARIVETMERLYGDRLGEQIERLAHHALCGEVWEKAVHVSQAGRTQGGGAVGAPGSPGVVRPGAGCTRRRCRRARPHSSRASRFASSSEAVLNLLGDVRQVLGAPARGGGPRRALGRRPQARACPSVHGERPRATR